MTPQNENKAVALLKKDWRKLAGASIFGFIRQQTTGGGNMTLFEIFMIIGMGGIIWEIRKMEQLLAKVAIKMVIHDRDIEALKKQAHTY